MKNSLFTMVLLLVSTIAMAVPAKRGIYQVICLTDGSEVQAEFCGDEFVSFWTDDNGKRYIKAANSDLYEEVDIETIQAIGNERRAQGAALQMQKQTSVSDAPRRKDVALGGEHEPFEGEKKCLVILVNFADSKFGSERDKTYYQRFANEENFTDEYGNTHSVRDYFLAQSYGKFALSFDVAGPVELKNDYVYYGHNNSKEGYPAMVQEACDGAYNEGIDFADYDWDGDGMVEQIFIIFAGHGAADTGNNDYVWPHKSALGSRRTYNYDDHTTSVSTYACSAELAGTGNGDGKGDGIGTMCHEFSHCLGLPDVYDTLYGGNYGMEYWSVMDQGSYNGNRYGYLPAGYTSYERMYCGWLTPTELTAETEVTGMKGLTEGGEAYIIYNKGCTDEYYLLENRTFYDFDAKLPGEGLLIVHIDYDMYYWQANVVNSNYYGNTHSRYTVIPADNNFGTSSSSVAKDAWPTDGKTRLTNTTTPADEVYNANSDGSYFMNISIYNIQQSSADSTISFDFYPSGTTPSSGTAPDGAIFYESFNNCEGAGGNDGDFGSSAVGSGTFYPDNSDWTCSTAHGADACAFFGTNTQAANVTTPTFTISGETTFSFRAAPYTALVPAVVSISCETTGITLSTTEISLPQGEWTDFTITLNGTGDVQLHLKETTGINRFFLDEVAAVPIVPEGIAALPADADTTPRQGVYSLQGVYLGTSTEHLKSGIYVVNGKKCVVK